MVLDVILYSPATRSLKDRVRHDRLRPASFQAHENFQLACLVGFQSSTVLYHGVSKSFKPWLVFSSELMHESLSHWGLWSGLRDCGHRYCRGQSRNFEFILSRLGLLFFVNLSIGLASVLEIEAGSVGTLLVIVVPRQVEPQLNPWSEHHKIEQYFRFECAN